MGVQPSCTSSSHNPKVDQNRVYTPYMADSIFLVAAKQRFYDDPCCYYMMFRNSQRECAAILHKYLNGYNGYNGGGPSARLFG